MMKNKVICGVLAVAMGLTATVVYARNYVSGYTVTKVYDQRPHKQQVDIDISPVLHNCNTMSFTVGYNGLTDEHLDRAMSIALAALTTGKKVGGFWGEAQDGCFATNIHISK